MSRSLDIFIGTNLTLDQVASRISEIMDARFERRSVKGEVQYECEGSALPIMLGEHDLIDNGDLHFTDFQFVLGIWAIGLIKGKERIKTQERLGSEIFELLKATGEFRLLMVDDTQVKLAEFNPSPE